MVHYFGSFFLFNIPKFEQFWFLGTLGGVNFVSLFFFYTGTLFSKCVSDILKKIGLMFNPCTTTNMYSKVKNILVEHFYFLFQVPLKTVFWHLPLPHCCVFSWVQDPRVKMCLKPSSLIWSLSFRTRRHHQLLDLM